MKKIIVRGGRELNGDVYISGMKNAALPILFACILNKGKNILYNVPQVSDIALTLDILESMGARVEFCLDGAIVLDTEGIRSQVAPYELVS